MTPSLFCPWSWTVLMTAACLCFVPTGRSLRLSPFIDPACPVDCSWPYYDEFNRPEMQFCEMILDRMDGLADQCSNPFAPPNDPDDRPSEVTDVRVLDYNKKFNSSDGSTEQYSCINITYNLDYRFVKGLQLNLRGRSGVDMNRYYCVNLNFSQKGVRSTALPEEGKSFFPCFCGLRPDQTYDVTVRTMPVLISGTRKYDTTVPASHGPGSCGDDKKDDFHCKKSPAASWKPRCITIKQNPLNYDELQVSFELAPASFCFHKYEVHIYMRQDAEQSHVAFQEINAATAVNGTCPGTASTNVSFATANFDISDRLKPAQYYAIIQPYSTCDNCKKLNGDPIDCTRSFSEVIYAIEDPCKTNPCTSNGRCIADNDEYNCVCLPGYMLWNGTCQDDPCSNMSECGWNGTCNIAVLNDTILGRNCTCDPGYSIHDKNICELADDTWFTVAIVGMSCISGVLLFVAVFSLLKFLNPFKMLARSRESPSTYSDVQQDAVVDLNPGSARIASRPSSADVATRNVTEPVFGRKRVLPIFSEDHPKHKEVVVSLCRFLKAECQCEVSLLDWCTPVGPSVEMWLTNAIDNADVVLLLCSKGTGQKYTARANQKRVPNNPSYEYGDVFVKALTLLDDYFGRDDATEKFVVAYFDYSTEDDIPVTFRRFPKYSLMRCMETLYLRIHDRVRDSPSSSRRVPALASYCNLERGLALHKAIQAMKDLIAADSKWYENHNRRHSSSGTSGYLSDIQDISFPFEHLQPPPGFFDEASVCSDDSEDFNTRLLQLQEMPRSPLRQDTSTVPTLQAHVPLKGQNSPESVQLTSDVQPPSDSGFYGKPSDYEGYSSDHVIHDSQV